jgi:hypothetical protein
MWHEAEGAARMDRATMSILPAVHNQRINYLVVASSELR